MQDDHSLEVAQAANRVADQLEGARADARKREKDFYRSLVEGEIPGLSGLDISAIEGHLETLVAQGKYEYVTTSHGLVLRIDRANPSKTWTLSLKHGDGGAFIEVVSWVRVEVGDDAADE